MRAERAASLALLAVLCVGVCAVRPAGARAQVFAEELRTKGWWPDLGLTFGAGFGLDHKLDTPVLGRARIGALYAYEPLILSFGVSGELGALARRGLGAEVELTHFGGGWLQAGFERVRGADFMTHATLGYTIIGVEWQHRFDSVPGNALLFVLRVPIGTWWFLLHDDSERKRAQERRLHPDKH
ncbi:MAG: hypothetical protein ACHQ53_08310 [Polyangiales bacterium]